MRRLLETVRRSKNERPILEFDCLSRKRLLGSSEDFKSRVRDFQILEASSDPGLAYRSSFYFQFSTTFDGLIDVRSFFPGPVRSVELMQLIGKRMQFDAKHMLAIGSHNGAELYWLYDNSDANILGIEENEHFVEFSQFLVKSFGLSDRLNIRRSEALEFLDTTDETFDLVILHGLIYMLKDPLHFLNRIERVLTPGGLCSIETYTLKSRQPIMQYVGDGSGWGDTFRFSDSFLRGVLPDIGLDIDEVLPYRHRSVYIVSKQ